MYIMYMFVIVLVLIMFLSLPLLMKMRLERKIMILTIERNKNISLSLAGIKGNLANLITPEGTEIYHVDPEKVLIANYPMSGLKIMQHKVPCLIYVRDNPEPLDPASLTILPKSISAREIGSAMDEHIIDEIVRATEEGAKTKLSSLIVPLATLAAVIIVLGLVWFAREQISVLVVQMSELITLFREGGVP